MGKNISSQNLLCFSATFGRMQKETEEIVALFFSIVLWVLLVSIIKERVIQII